MLLGNLRLSLRRAKHLLRQANELRHYTQGIRSADHESSYASSTEAPTVVLFPGQGSQFVGMAKSLVHIPEAKQLFDAASEILKQVVAYSANSITNARRICKTQYTFPTDMIYCECVTKVHSRS